MNRKIDKFEVDLKEPTNHSKNNNKILELLNDKNTTNLTLLICLSFSKIKVFQIVDSIKLDKEGIKKIHTKIINLKGNETTKKYVNISDRELKNNYTKGKIKNELERLEREGYLYLNDYGVYCTDLFTPTIIKSYIHDICWLMFINGSEITKNSIKYILQQMIEMQSQDVKFSQSKLLKWIKENTDKKSVKGSDYSKTLKLFKDEEFLEYITVDQYLVNTDYIRIK